jgi:hypothetical protein
LDEKATVDSEGAEGLLTTAAVAFSVQNMALGSAGRQQELFMDTQGDGEARPPESAIGL